MREQQNSTHIDTHTANRIYYIIHVVLEAVYFFSETQVKSCFCHKTDLQNQSIKDNHDCGINGKIWSSDSYLPYSHGMECAFKVISPKIQLHNDLLNFTVLQVST